MRFIEPVRMFLANYWQTLLWYGGAAFLALLLLFFQLGSLTGHVGIDELAARDQAGSLRSTWESPYFAPHKIIQGGLVALNQTNAFAIRSVSALFGFAAIAMFYITVARWHNRQVALMSTLLFATSSWLLHAARFATPDIMFTLLIGLVLFGTWVASRKANPELTLLIGSAAAAVLLYLPGGIWFLLAGVAWQHRKIWYFIRQSPGIVWASVAIFVILIFPLVFAIAHDTQVLWPLAGLPHTLPNLSSIRQALGDIPLALFFQAPIDPQRRLGNLALLDVFSCAMALLGMYYYIQHFRLQRSWFLLGYIALASVLISLQGPVSFTILLPVVYLLIAGGLAYMMQEWFRVFPRNPIARTIGSTLLIIVVTVTCLYHLNRYYVAWSHAPETKAVFRHTTE